MLSMNLMYKYVDFYRGIYLECLFLFIFIREGVGICAVLRGTGGGGGLRNKNRRFWSWGGSVFYRDVPPPAPQAPSTNSITVQAGRDLKSRGLRSVRVRGGQPGIVWNSSRGGQPVNIHCRWRWQSTSTLSGARRMTKEGNIRIAQSKTVGGGSGRLLEEEGGLRWKTPGSGTTSPDTK